MYLRFLASFSGVAPWTPGYFCLCLSDDLRFTNGYYGAGRCYTDWPVVGESRCVFKVFNSPTHGQGVYIYVVYTAKHNLPQTQLPGRHYWFHKVAGRGSLLSQKVFKCIPREPESSRQLQSERLSSSLERIREKQLYIHSLDTCWTCSGALFWGERGKRPLAYDDLPPSRRLASV